MSTAVGGSIESVSLRGRLFPVAADADASRSLGGFTNEVAPNGNGTARIIKKRVPWKISGLDLEVNETRGDQEFLQDIADGKDFVAISITLVSGAVWQGRGIITDDLEFSTEKSTAGVTLMGPKKLEQQ
jgi:hypothetical protein